MWKWLQRALVGLLLLLISCPPPLAVQKYQQAIKIWQKGDKKEAITLLKEAVDHNPNYYEAYQKLIHAFEDADSKVINQVGSLI